MSSGTRYDPGPVRKLITGLAEKLTAGGERVENVQQAVRRISNLGMSPRQLMLNYLWGWYRTEQYATRKLDWNGREAMDPIEHEAIASAGFLPPGFYDAGDNLPIKFRRPTAPYALTKVVVDRFTGLLFSERHHPEVRVDGDPDTEDFLQTVVREGRLWPQMIMARTYGGAMGTVAIGFQFVDGEVEFEVHDPRWCRPKFIDRARLKLQSIEKRYMYPTDELNEDGTGYDTVWYWYRRVIDETHDVLWPPMPVGDGTEPPWAAPPVMEAATVIEHGFGFCPVVWMQNMPVQDDIDGDPDCLGGYETIEAIDALLAQANKGVLANCDPTLSLSTDADMSEVRKGSDNAIKLPVGSSANYLEISGSGPRSGLELAEKLRKQFLEVVQCVLEHPDVGNRTATEIERVYSAMIAKADVMREQYGEKGILELLGMVVKAVRQMEDPRPDPETGQLVRATLNLPPRIIFDELGQKVPVPRRLGLGGMLKLQWPKYFEPMLSDVELATRSAIAAKAGRLIDQEHAVKYVAEHYNVKDVQQMMANIEHEAMQEQEDMAAQALGMLRAPGVPSEPEIEAEENPDALEEEGTIDEIEDVEGSKERVEEDAPQSMSAEEAAALLGVSKATIHNAIKRGQLPGNKVGNKYVILRENLMKWLDAGPTQ